MTVSKTSTVFLSFSFVFFFNYLLWFSLINFSLKEYHIKSVVNIMKTSFYFLISSYNHKPHFCPHGLQLVSDNTYCVSEMGAAQHNIHV